ncbi:hypothetical protein F5Y15DRAFT_378189 [Xylariaceae sp. FL0016]|nr:hypothetical protein F5Y15DRAFT_378189 [Xylariaceae sp. FL0016]
MSWALRSLAFSLVSKVLSQHEVTAAKTVIGISPIVRISAWDSSDLSDRCHFLFFANIRPRVGMVATRISPASPARHEGATRQGTVCRVIDRTLDLLCQAA